jgi:hypothetical protein
VRLSFAQLCRSQSIGAEAANGAMRRASVAYEKYIVSNTVKRESRIKSVLIQADRLGTRAQFADKEESHYDGGTLEIYQIHLGVLRIDVGKASGEAHDHRV